MARTKKEVTQDGLQDQGQEAPKEVTLVPMEREGKTADVHPLEVENMKSYGWKVI